MYFEHQTEQSIPSKTYQSSVENIPTLTNVPSTKPLQVNKPIIRDGDLSGSGPSLEQIEVDTLNIITILDYEEGYRAKPYLCSEGYVTIGYGTKLSNIKNLDPSTFIIEFNRNIAKQFMAGTVQELDKALLRSSQSDVFFDLDDDKRAIILSMSYQLGVSGVLGFKNMWKALAAEDWERAGIEALDSRWANQTPARANRHARVLAGESLESVYGG